MLLNLLCTQERMHRLGASPTPLCKLCKQETGTLQHELLYCTFNDNIGHLLVRCMKNHVPNLTANTLLHLELSSMDHNLHLPATILISTTLDSIWKDRNNNSRVCTYKVRSELEQSVSLLRRTRLTEEAESLSMLLGQMFQ